MMQEHKINTLIPHRSVLAEGPVWNEEAQMICWVDILNGEIHRYSPEKNKHSIIALKQLVGSVAVCTDGNFIAALQNGFAFVNSQTEEIKMINDPESHLLQNRFNDGKCDPAGRFWAGTMSLLESPEAGHVYMMGNDFKVSKKIDKVSISNGMAWSLDHRIFYYIDTPTFTVVAYDFDKISGTISNKKIIINVPEAEGFPDGMTIDAEGMLWIGHWQGWQVSRWNPDTGKKIYSIKLPVAKVTSCTFGGRNFKDMYITSARVHLSEKELAEQPLAGSVFVITDCGFTGVPAFKFRKGMD